MGTTELDDEGLGGVEGEDAGAGLDIRDWAWASSARRVTWSTTSLISFRHAVISDISWQSGKWEPVEDFVVKHSPRRAGPISQISFLSASSSSTEKATFDAPAVEPE